MPFTETTTYPVLLWSRALGRLVSFQPNLIRRFGLMFSQSLALLAGLDVFGYRMG